MSDLSGYFRFGCSQQVLQFAKLFSEAASDNFSLGKSSAEKGLSKELSDLVVYCQAVKVPKPFVPAKIELMQP